MHAFTRAAIRSAIVLAVFFGLLSSGCSAGVFNYRGDIPPARAPRPLPAQVAMNPLAFPHVSVTVVQRNQPQEEVGSTRFLALEDRLRELLSDSGMASAVVPSADVGANGLPSPSFVVEYAIRSYHSTQSVDEAGMAGAIVGMVLTGGLGSMLICAPTNRIHQQFAVELRVARAEDARLVSRPDPVTARSIAQYDTAGAPAVLSRRYDLELQSGHPTCSPPSGEGLLELTHLEGRQMAQLIFEASAREVYEAIGRSLATQEPAPPPATAGAPSLPTSGGEAAVSFRDQVRERLDGRADALLLCANRPMLAVTASWSDGAEVELALRDVDDSAVVECARAALGPMRAPAQESGRLLHVIQH